MAGRTVLITGGSGGIGQTTGLGLAQMRADLAIIGRDRARTEDAAREIRAAGGGRVDMFITEPRTPRTLQRLFVPILRPFMKSPTQGAATSIHVASAPELEQVTGRYFTNGHVRKSSKPSYDQATAARLWQVSTDLVGLTAARNPAGHLLLVPKISGATE